MSDTTLSTQSVANDATEIASKEEQSLAKVMSFGEALIDFLAQNTGVDEVQTFAKYPGGAPANVAVAVARLGGNSHFVGQVGNDSFGHFLKDSLNEYGVNTNALLMTSSAKTALAFVSLDETGERSFEFYRNPSADMLFRPEDFLSEWFYASKGVFHTCSNTLTDESITKATNIGVKLAKMAGWIVSADINLRTNLWPEQGVDVERVIDWFQAADVVKASMEELAELSDDPMALIQDSLAKGVSLFVLTDGANAVRYFHSSGITGEVATPKVDVKDTTAAGDAFVGGLLFRLSEIAGETSVALMTQEELQNAVEFSVACGASAVTKLGAYPSLPSKDEAEAMLNSFTN